MSGFIQTVPTAGLILAGKLIGANFNTTADQAIPIILPPGITKWRINSVVFTNPSLSMTTAAGGIYTAASKGGSTIVSAAQAYTALVAPTDVLGGTLGTAGQAIAQTITTAYLSLTTAQGAAATLDLYVFVLILPTF